MSGVSGVGYGESGEAKRSGTQDSGVEAQDSGLRTQDLVVRKVQRSHPVLGFPLGWLGRKAAGAARRWRYLQALQGIRGIPDYLGRWGKVGFLHAYVPGEPGWRRTWRLLRRFFEQLQELFEAIHGRHVAYVDANKREKYFDGREDGRPWLIDFQISYRHARARANWFSRWMLRRLMRADWYHFYKHKTRLLPEGCSAADFAAARERGWLHRMHRMVARPMIRVRRRWLGRYELEKTK